MEYFKKILKEKKELFLFMGILVTLFATVISVASFNSDTTTSSVSNNDGIIRPEKPDEDDKKDPIIEKMILPISDNFTVSRDYFEFKTPSTLEDSVLNRGIEYVESNGISYSHEFGKTFDVVSTYSGEVIDVSRTSYGSSKVRIKNSEDVETIYYSLSDVQVSIGEQVSQGQILGTAGFSERDPEIGIHVHIEVIVDGNYVKPSSIIGKEINSLVASYEK